MIPSIGVGGDPGHSAKKVIVVCDDNASLTALMQHLLRKRGFRVLTASEGGEGLELVRAASPDLLLLDLAMPGTDGLAVLQSMTTHAGKRPYTMVVTSQAGEAERGRAAEYGAREVWKKPFNAADLIGRIEGLIAEGAI